MTIMLTWSAAMGFSSTFMPEAEAANEHLYVSAEAVGAFAGVQVLEIVVSEASISELDTDYGMPDVTVDGAKIIMAQGVDGSWYAYIADADTTNNLDSQIPETSTGTGKGADYGRLCGPTTNIGYISAEDGTPSSLTASDTRGIWIPGRTGESSASVQGTAAYEQGDSISDCSITQAEHTAGTSATGVNATSTGLINVVREPTALSNGTTLGQYGNIQLGANLWPLILSLIHISEPTRPY